MKLFQKKKIKNLSKIKIIHQKNKNPPKVLVLTAQLGDFTAEQHEVHCLPSIPPLPLHRHLRPPRDAAVWGRVSGVEGGGWSGDGKEWGKGSEWSGEESEWSGGRE